MTEERRDRVAEQIEVLHERREEFARGTRARDASLEIAPAESSAGLRSALEAERELMAAILRSTGDGLVAVDRTGTITLVNDVAETLLDVRRENLLRRRLADTLAPPHRIDLRGNLYKTLPLSGRI